jgi:hypothetical protein
MHRIAILTLTVICVLLAGLVSGQSYAPPQPQPPDEATLNQIKEKSGELEKVIRELRQRGLVDELLVYI